MALTLSDYNSPQSLLHRDWVLMGNFYTNYTLRGVTPQAVAAALAGRACVVTPAVRDTVVVFDKESDEQNLKTLSSLASELSAKLSCPVLAMLNHDDDLLWYQLYSNGSLQDEYDSSPGILDEQVEAGPPVGGNAEVLCSAFGSTQVAEVERILRKSVFDDDGYAFAFMRHAALVKALDIAPFGVGGSYTSIENDPLPEGLNEKQLLRLHGRGRRTQGKSKSRRDQIEESMYEMWVAQGQLGQALFFAAHKGNVEYIREKLNAGVAVDTRLDNSTTPLMEAARMGRLELTRVLVEAGADVNARCGHRGMTPLLFCMESAYFQMEDGTNHLKVLQFLLERGANPNIRGHRGESAWAYARQRKDRDELHALLRQFGAKPDENA